MLRGQGRDRAPPTSAQNLSSPPPSGSRTSSRSLVLGFGDFGVPPALPHPISSCPTGQTPTAAHTRQWQRMSLLGPFLCLEHRWPRSNLHFAVLQVSWGPWPRARSRWELHIFDWIYGRAVLTHKAKVAPSLPHVSSCLEGIFLLTLPPPHRPLLSLHFSSGCHAANNELRRAVRTLHISEKVLLPLTTSREETSKLLDCCLRAA